MSFCDFCTCENCKTGIITNTIKLSHAQCNDGRWICDVCYSYDLCTAAGPNRNNDGPCKSKDCIHRPKLIGEWIK